VRVSASSELPAGPSSRLLATVRFARDPYTYFVQCRARYGDPFTLPLMGSQAVISGRADLVREVYAMPPSKVGGLLGHLMPEVLGPASVLVLSGAAHSQERKLQQPMFHGKRVGAWASIIADVTRTKAAAHRPSEPFKMYELGRSIALDVILKALFGVRDQSKLEAVRAAVLRFTEAGSPLLIFFRALRRNFGGVGPWARAMTRLDELDVLLNAQIVERRGQTGGDDLLSMLIEARYDDGTALTDLQIRDQLVSLILAGHETMAVTLAWAMHWLLTDREVRARLDEELGAAGDDVLALPFLDAVCKETLRIYPIQPVVMRQLLEPADFAGFALPAGAFVGAATTLVHMDPAIYPEPEKFRPERFLGPSPGGSEFFPFGGGARRCLGATLAMAELKIVLATLLREFRFRPVDPRTPRPVRQSTVTGPSGGVELIREMA
jgi:cytochrome P450